MSAMIAKRLFFFETKIQVRVQTSDTLELNKVSVGVSLDFVGDPFQLFELFDVYLHCMLCFVLW